MNKVVIDTNVFVSSFFGGIPRKIIDLWKNGKITLCLSQAIIEEYIDVLIRLGIDNSEINDLIKLFAENYCPAGAHVTSELGRYALENMNE